MILQTVDKHKGVTISSKKNRLETRDLQLKQELRVALKSSIYRIISTYGNHLNSISLPAEHKKKIASYKMFQEGQKIKIFNTKIRISLFFISLMKEISIYLDDKMHFFGQIVADDYLGRKVALQNDTLKKIEMSDFAQKS